MRYPAGFFCRPGAAVVRRNNKTFLGPDKHLHIDFQLLLQGLSSTIESALRSKTRC
jgi:hypothetical protein